MNSKKVVQFAVVLFCSLCFALVTHAQQRLWGVSVDGELFFIGSIVYKNEALSGMDHVRFGESLPAGIYLMTVVTDGGERVTRLVKE